MERENIRAIALCAMVCVSAYLFWACYRIQSIFDPAWPRSLPYPDPLVDAWAGWVLSLPQQQGLFCGNSLLWIIHSTFHCLLGACVLATIIIAKPFILSHLPFRPRPGYCTCCGYDAIASLAALSTHCPECGHSINPTETLKRRPDLSAVIHRHTTRILIIACLHWTFWSGGIIANTHASGYMWGFGQDVMKVFGFPMIQVFEHTASLGSEYMLPVLMTFNSLLWGFVLTLLLEAAKRFNTSLIPQFARTY